MVLTSFNASTKRNAAEYPIAATYEGKSLDNAKVITDAGIRDAKVVLLPYKLAAGKYVVNVIRKGKDIYKIDGMDIYIETRFCYEILYGQEATVTIEPSYGNSVGTIKF